MNVEDAIDIDVKTLNNAVKQVGFAAAGYESNNLLSGIVFNISESTLEMASTDGNRLARAKEAYLAEIDTLEQYAQNKKDISERIENLKARGEKQATKEIDIDAFAKKVAGIVEFIERDDVTASAKNEALHNIIEKIVYEKAKGNLAIYFHDI